jgi:pyrrolidone-carboxylate peptidase
VPPDRALLYHVPSKALQQQMTAQSMPANLSSSDIVSYQINSIKKEIIQSPPAKEMQSLTRGNLAQKL